MSSRDVNCTSLTLRVGVHRRQSECHRSRVRNAIADIRNQHQSQFCEGRSDLRPEQVPDGLNQPLGIVRHQQHSPERQRQNADSPRAGWQNSDAGLLCCGEQILQRAL